MGATHFSGPVSVGTKQAGETGGPNQGLVTLEQTVKLQADSTAVVSGLIRVPKGAVILGYYIDTLTAWGGSSSALTIGKTAGGFEYCTVVTPLTAVRAAPTLSAAQLAAMRNVTIAGVPVADNLLNQDLYVSVAVGGTPNNNGTTYVTVLYYQP